MGQRGIRRTGAPGGVHREWFSHRAARQRGAALVEFAIAMPLLVLLLLGIVEFGWVLGQFNEIRHGAQEGARWGAVSKPDINGGGISGDDLVARVCGAANLPGGTSLVVSASSGGGAKGDTGTVTVQATIQSLTGIAFITAFLPATLSTTATFRLEQPAPWSSASGTCP